jgi:outer membrane protein assembly factor BamB
MNRTYRAAATAFCILATLAASLPAAAQDWPMFHQNARHGGVSTETTIGSSTAPQLGLRWEANTGARSYTSPVVAYNAKLAKALVYVGNSAGDLSAYDARTGDRVWVYPTGAAIQSTPAVAAGTVYVGSGDHYLYALNAATGALVCRFLAGGVISSSPVVADPDGSGRVVYFGDNGLSGNDDGGREWAVNGVDPNAAANCTAKWSFSTWGEPAGTEPLVGSWSPPAFAKDATGRPLLVIGSSSPEGAVYALDARTGARVWRTPTRQEFDSDVGAGPTVSAPGTNGFPDGAVYVAGKDRVLYAMNLRTGAIIWQFDIAADSPAAEDPTRSTAALVGKRVYLGYGDGMYAVDAVTGKAASKPGLWKTSSGAPILSSPAVSGASGDRVVLAGDVNGVVRGLDLLTGAERWSFDTGGLIYASPAVSGGKVFITSGDGFLYAFGLGGGVSAAPDTTLEAPAAGGDLPNTGTLALSGHASDDTGVTRVLVAVKNLNTAKWWNAANGTWGRTFQQLPATMSGPATARTWNASMPMPSGGGVFYAQAEAVDADGQHDPTIPNVGFTVESLTQPPDTAITMPTPLQTMHFPTDGDGVPIAAPFEVAVSGTATDPGGAHPGVDHIMITIRNDEHLEYYCGVAGCGTSGEASAWSPVLTTLSIPVANPGATTTSWSTIFFTYDHPHTYSITAWAVDRDGRADATRASVHMCVRPPDVEICY